MNSDRYKISMRVTVLEMNKQARLGWKVHSHGGADPEYTDVVFTWCLFEREGRLVEPETATERVANSEGQMARVRYELADIKIKPIPGYAKGSREYDAWMRGYGDRFFNSLRVAMELPIIPGEYSGDGK